MPARSAITHHPQRDTIDKWIFQQKPDRWIASQLDPPVSHASVQRYRIKYLSPALQRAAARSAGIPIAPITDGPRAPSSANFDERANPFIMRANALYGEAWQAVQDSKRAVTTIVDDDGNERIKGRDLSVMAPILSAATRTLELYGKGTGYLNDAAGAVTNVVIVQNYAAGAAQHDTQQAADDDGQVLDVVAEK